VRILITGGAGFIGSHTAEALLQKGHTLRIIDNLDNHVHSESTRPVYLADDIEFMHGDVRNRADLEKAVDGIDAVYHFAVYNSNSPDFSKYAEVNDVGTALLYEIIVNRRLHIQKIVLASSQSIYGEGEYTCIDHGVQYPPPRSRDQLRRGEWGVKCPLCQKDMEPLITDEIHANPHNQYAVSKYAQELYALTLGRRYGIPTVILRYSEVQGPGKRFYNIHDGILRIFAVKLLSGNPITFYEDGNQLRDYVHVSDVVAANLLVLESVAADYDVFNVGGSRAYSVSEFTKILLKIMGKNVRPQKPGEFRFGDVRHIISDISKLRKLGWEPQKTIEQNIREYLTWLQAQPNIRDYYTETEKILRQQGTIQPIAR
jgi:dTDP-L-rhamnose 4-epimerase